jgi:predicted DNA-binding transcriptional regulator AlpA
MASDSYYLRTADVQRRYGGVSRMWLWRNLNNSKSGFPKPRYFGRQRFWLVSDLVEWETNYGVQAAKSDESDG